MGADPPGDLRDETGASPPSFGSPERAVREVERLRNAADWEALAARYDLRGSEVDRGRIASRDWFEEGLRPEAHPRGGRAAGEPFPPGSSYVDHAVDGAVARVTVTLDPAVLPTGAAGSWDGAPPALGVFFLVRAGDGWRLLAPDDTRIGP